MGRGKSADASAFWKRYAARDLKDLSIVLSTKIKPSTLSSYKTESRYPRADEAVAIAKAIGTTVEYLVTGESAAGWKPPQRITRIVDAVVLLDDKDLEVVAVLAETLASQVAARRPASGGG